jgi:16S rRNA processing protein RimM
VTSERPPILAEDGSLCPAVVVGTVSGLHGLRGWVKVHSYTAPRENILTYSPWYLYLGGRWRAMESREGRLQGKGLVARIAGCHDRDEAAGLLGADIAVRRDQLPVADDEYYWTDLEGLRVLTVEGVDLGVVDHLFETGANDVLVVRGARERLIPYLPGPVVRSVDLRSRSMVVDWDPDF